MAGERGLGRNVKEGMEGVIGGRPCGVATGPDAWWKGCAAGC